MKWIIQKNLTKEIDYNNLIAAFEHYNIEYHSIEIIPFSDELPKLEVTNPVICYGSTTLIKNVYLQKLWSPGVWFDPEKFTTTTWLSYYGDLLLNSDAKIMPLNEVMSQSLDTFFIRPDNDLKDFSGSITNKEEYIKWYKRMEKIDFDLTIPIIIAAPKHLGKEWRFIIINGKVITGSLYRLRSMMPRVCEQPPKAVAFAEHAAKLFSPAPVFVMDIGDVGGDYKIIELNCFNASGFYSCDIDKIVKNIQDMS